MPSPSCGVSKQNKLVKSRAFVYAGTSTSIPHEAANLLAVSTNKQTPSWGPASCKHCTVHLLLPGSHLSLSRTQANKHPEPTLVNLHSASVCYKNIQVNKWNSEHPAFYEKNNRKMYMTSFILPQPFTGKNNRK